MNKATVRDLFSYNPDGTFTRRKDLANGYKAGTVVTGRTDVLGYKIISVNNKSVKMHRAVFVYHYGFLPKHVDHINRIKTDNRIENLRAADASTNTVNTKYVKGCVPYKGVAWHKHMQRYISQIRHNGKSYHLGYFSSAVCAALARDEKAKELFGEFACLNF